MAKSPDVVVIGGGPAGTTAAMLLARWGHSVRLFTKPEADHRLAVSLPPSCAKLFDAIGVSDAVAHAGFLRSTGNTVWWGGHEARIETFAGGALGWQLEVERLADVLLERAVAAGVERHGGWPASGAPPDHAAGFVIDCSGRSGLLARQMNLRQFDDAARTVALVAEWHRNDPWPVPDHTHTLIESYADGWMWSVPVAPGARHVAAMVDPRRSSLAKGESASDMYLAEIAKTRMFKDLIAGAVMQGGPRGWDASQYRAREYAGEGWLLAGDAGSFIDPLSSAGVKKALASGWLAAIVAHTCLTSPSMRPHALAFFDAREREIAEQLTRQSRRFLADAAANHQHAFWADRSDDADAMSSDDAGVQAAFERLKANEAWRPRVGDAITIEPRPCIRGNKIVLEPHIVTADEPSGVRYVRAIDVVALVRMAPATRRVPDLYDEYVRRIGSIPLPEFLFAVATAVARGWLVAE